MSLIQQTIEKITIPNKEVEQKAHDRLSQLTMPHWALGRLMDLSKELAVLTESMDPKVERKAIVTMAADHGVVSEGISLYPPEVTPQMVYNFVNGGAGINALSKQSGCKVYVVDMGVNSDLSTLVHDKKIIDKKIDFGTQNMTVTPAMTREQAIKSIESGIEVSYELEDEVDVFGTGDMGIGNTTSSAAICSILTSSSIESVTGNGTGIDEVQLKNKVEVIKKAISKNKPNKSDVIDVLSKVGGFEIGGIVGLILGASSQKKPIVIDGFISTAGALIADELCKSTRHYILPSHQSVEKGHRIMWEYLGKEPYLDLGFRLGEGTGAALMMNLIQAAKNILTEVATFEEAAVSGFEK